MTAAPDLADRYVAAWNETEPAARRALVADVFAEDVRYTDPLADVTGHDAIEATIAAVQAQFPGSVFRLTGPVDAHHDQVRCEIGGLARIRARNRVGSPISPATGRRTR